MSGLSLSEGDALARSAQNRMQSRLDLTRGPVARALIVDRGAAPSSLFLAVHHWAVDGVSWRLLLEELASDELLSEAAPCEALALPEWAGAVARRLPEAATREWLASLPRVCTRFGAGVGGRWRVGDLRALCVALGPAESQAVLVDAPRRLSASVTDVLLAGLSLALARVGVDGDVRVDVESHGRNAHPDLPEVGSVVGWFTEIEPAFLAVGRADPVTELARLGHQRALASRRGAGFMALRQLGPSESRVQLEKLDSAQICFNYLGRFGAELLGASSMLGGTASSEKSAVFVAPGGDEVLGFSQDSEFERDYEIDMTLSAVGDRLYLHAAYDERHPTAFVERLLESYCRGLDELTRVTSGVCAIEGAAEVGPEDLSEVLRQLGDLK